MCVCVYIYVYKLWSSILMLEMVKDVYIVRQNSGSRLFAMV